MDFLAESNICGQSLLRLVARGSAIIAELLRLTDYVPPPVAACMEPAPEAAAAGAGKYGRILWDFRYLKTPEMFDEQIHANVELSEVDAEFLNTYEEVLGRFYGLFESIYK